MAFHKVPREKLKGKDGKPGILIGLELERHAEGQNYKRQGGTTSFEDLPRQISLGMGEWAQAGWWTLTEQCFSGL